MLTLTVLALGATASCGLLFMMAKNAPLVPECYDSCGKLHCPACAMAARLRANRDDRTTHECSDVLSDLSA